MVRDAELVRVGSARPAPRSSTRAAALGRVLAGCLLLAAVAVLGAFLAARPQASAFDRWGLSQLPHAYHSLAFQAVAELGNPLVVGVVALLGAAATWRADRLRAASLVLGPLLGGLLELAAKHAVGRLMGTGLTYPSGHAVGAAAVGTVLALAARGRWRLLACGMAAVVELGVAVAVVALGWHFPTDALGGLALGTGSVLVVDGGAHLPGA